MNSLKPGTGRMLERLTPFYEVCQHPAMNLHWVESSCVQRCDRAIQAVLRLLPNDEPVVATVGARLRCARWALLSETRLPQDWWSEYHSAIADVEQNAEWLGLEQGIAVQLRHAVDEYAKLGHNPLTSALLRVLLDPNWGLPRDHCVVPVVPSGSSSGVVDRRLHGLASVLAKAGVSRGVPMSLAECRKSYTLHQSAVFLASPAAFGDAVITCPVARNSFFLFYDFVQVDYERDGWRHSFQTVAPKLATLPEPHWPVFSRWVHEDPVPSHDEELAEHRVRDRDVYPVFTLHERVTRAWSSEDRTTEAQECVLVDLADDLWAALPGRARTLRETRDGWEVHGVDPYAVVPGTPLLLLAQEPVDLAHQTEHDLRRRHGAGLDLWIEVQALYREQIADCGWTRCADGLRNAGIANPYSYWFEGGRLGPASRAASLCVCRHAGLTEPEAERVWEAMRAWQSYRVQVGFDLVHRFEEAACELLGSTKSRSEGLLVVTLPMDWAGTHAVVRFERVAGEGKMPTTKTRRVLTDSGTPWLGPSPGATTQRSTT